MKTKLILAILFILFTSQSLMAFVPMPPSLNQAYINSQLLTKANISVVGSSLNTNDLELTSGILGLTAEVPHIDEASTWSASQTFIDLTLSALAAAPSSPVVGKLYLADGTTWDPSGLSIGMAYYVVYIGSSTYVALFDVSGGWHLGYIPLPTYLSSELTDSTTPYVLDADEVKGTQITNSGASGSEEYDFPAGEEGINVIFMKETNQTMTVCPTSGEALKLRDSDGVYSTLTTNHCIQNSTNEESDLACASNNAGVIRCASASANWGDVAHP